MPAAADAAEMYVDYHSEDNKSSAILRRINSPGRVVKLFKSNDSTKDSEVVLALKRMHRKIGRAQRRASLLTKMLLYQLAGSISGRRDGKYNS
jgi:hypothetical protein